MGAEPTRTMRNHSLINESNLKLNKSIEKPNMDSHNNKSVPKIQSTNQAHYFNNSQQNYKIKKNH
jgi:hypothetical protein